MQKQIIDLISARLNQASLNDKPEVADAMAELITRIQASAPAADGRVFRVLANGEHTLVSGETALERLAEAMREPRPTFFLITA